MMLRQRLAIAADTPNLIPMPTAHAPPDRSTRQIAVRPYFRPLENRRSHSSNPHRSQRRNRAPSGPRFRALALLGRLSWERVDAFVMQASEKPAQNETVAIVADAVDRFQRSFKESVLIDELIRKEKIELHFYREAMVIGKGASSTDILRWDFSVMGAKSYVLILSENVRRSLEFKRRNGEWGGKAPLGYQNIRDANNKSALIHERAIKGKRPTL